MWDLPGLESNLGRTGRYIIKSFGGLKFTGLIELAGEKKLKLILWDCAGQIPGKIGQFCRNLWANFT